MLSAVEVFQDCEDRINPQENGMFTYAMFNRYSWLAQLRLLEWLSGDVSAIIPPEPYRSQKNRDWLSDFVTQYKTNVVDGIITKPTDYYLFQDLYGLRGNLEDCEDDDTVLIEDQPIILLGNDKFKIRAKTRIKRLKPSNDKPIVKEVGKTFVFNPIDSGSVVLEYIRYPLKASITPKIDEYNNQVPDTWVDFEWSEISRETLVWFITDSFANRNREQALKQTNIITGKVVRESR